MQTRIAEKERSRHAAAPDARAHLLAGIPVAERRLRIAGVETTVLEGGDGPPVVLLHGPIAGGPHWLRILPSLVATHRVVAPDLPGQGSSHIVEGTLDAELVLRWLGELIEQTCTTPPTLVGYTLGGAIAARFAGAQRTKLRALVLIDTLGLAAFQPTSAFEVAIHDFVAQPTDQTHDSLWRHCAFDLNSLQKGLAERWDAFKTYNLQNARTPSVMAAFGALLEEFGKQQISSAELASVTIPTTLVWGRHDTATPLHVADAASARFGWPLHVIENCGDDPPLEQPEAFLDVLRTALAAQAGVA